MGLLDLTPQLEDEVSNGKTTFDRALVEMVKKRHYVFITAKLPQKVRAALNKAVKSGLLLHRKKDTYTPEVYYYYFWGHEVIAEIERRREENKRIVSSVLC